MTTFDKREAGFENKFAHDEELRFKATARRNKLLGAWAADKMGITGAAADSYAKDLVAFDLAESGEEDVVRKLVADFKAKNVGQSEQQIRAAMDQLMATAVAQIEAK